MLPPWRLREKWGFFPLLEIHRFHATSCRFWGFSSFYTSKSAQKTTDFNKIRRFPKLTVSLMLPPWRLREKWAFLPILIEICGFHAKIRGFSGFCSFHVRICPESAQKSVDFTWNPRISRILHTWAFSFASSKVSKIRTHSHWVSAFTSATVIALIPTSVNRYHWFLWCHLH